jgi:hypothetical protein
VGPNPTEPASPNNYFRDSLPTKSRRYDIVTSTQPPSEEATPSSFSSLKASEKKNEGASTEPTSTTVLLEQATVAEEEQEEETQPLVPPQQRHSQQQQQQQPPSLPPSAPSASSLSPFPSYGALDLFLHSIGANETRRQYRNKLGTFLDFVGLQGATLEQKAELFVQYARMDNENNKQTRNSSSGSGSHQYQWAFAWIVKFILHHKARYEQKEITGGTLRNYYKPIRVFCEANDIAIGWLKITRGPAMQYSSSRCSLCAVASSIPGCQSLPNKMLPVNGTAFSSLSPPPSYIRLPVTLVWYLCYEPFLTLLLASERVMPAFQAYPVVL